MYALGPEFEGRIRLNEAGNTKFNFLNPHDPYHAYYRHKIVEIQEGVAQEAAAAASQQQAGLKVKEGRGESGRACVYNTWVKIYADIPGPHTICSLSSMESTSKVIRNFMVCTCSYVHVRMRVISTRMHFVDAWISDVRMYMYKVCVGSFPHRSLVLKCLKMWCNRNAWACMCGSPR